MGTAQRQHDVTWNAIQTVTEECRTQQTASAGPSSYARYLWRLLFIPALLYPFAFLLVCLPSYEHWSASQWGPMLEYPYDSRANADVVIFGDSSAFFGIDPRLVNAQLGIKSVVLPDTVGSIPVTGDEPLEAYLAHNRKPRLLVFYFSAWNLEFGHAAHGRLFEGEEMMLRHRSGREIASFATHHPLELLAFPFRLYSTFGPKIVSAAIHHVNREQVTTEALGHAEYTEPFAPLNDTCRIPANYLANTGDESVRSLVRRYTSPETKVMVYLAPVPACSNSAQLLTRSFKGVDAAQPRLLPPDSFAGDPYYAHILPGSVAAASKLFADALQRRLPE